MMVGHKKHNDNFCGREIPLWTKLLEYKREARAMDKPITEGTERQFILRLPQVRGIIQLARILFMA